MRRNAIVATPMLPDSRSDLQVAGHPSVNFPTEFGEGEAISIHVNEPDHLQNREHRSQRALWQILIVAPPLLFRPDFLDERIEANWLSARSQDSEDAGGCFRTSEELYQRIFQALQVSLGAPSRCCQMQAAPNQLTADNEQHQRSQHE
jgi:hypothetical protein